MTTGPPTDPGAGLLEEAFKAMKKSGVVWVQVPGHRPRAAWLLWQDGAVHVVAGGGEQELPGLREATEAVVTTPAPTTRARLADWRARVEVLAPQSPEWLAVTPALLEKRLNLHVAEDTLARWAADAAVVRLTPTGELVEGPVGFGPGYDDRPLAEPPAATAATTRLRRPWTLGRATRRRARPLS